MNWKPTDFCIHNNQQTVLAL